MAGGNAISVFELINHPPRDFDATDPAILRARHSVAVSELNDIHDRLAADGLVAACRHIKRAILRIERTTRVDIRKT